MDRRPSSQLLSWLLVPVAFVLVEAALSLPRQPYSGLALHRDRVMEVEPNSPGERAGLARGDRIVRLADGNDHVMRHEPMWGAAPGQPLLFERTRGETRDVAWLVPDPLPDGERRIMAAMLAVSSVFVLLGGWVWSERRDSLARTFFLMCLSFAWLLAPLRRWTTLAPRLVDQVVFTGIELYLPALVVHFFALFPEGRARGSRQRWIRAAYAIATLLFVPTMAIVAAQELGIQLPAEAGEIAQTVAALWFGLGLAAALGIFAASYRRAASGDARRRLRVVLFGTAAGVGPLAALIAVRNVWPGIEIPGERGAALLTLLVPASFAWATVVHRIFDFRVALRAVAMVALVATAGALAYAAGEWVTATWWPALGERFAGGALACVALAASLAGPAAPWLGSVGVRLLPTDEGRSLADWTSSEPVLPRSRSGRASLAHQDEGERVLADACEIVARSLRLDGCAALVFDERTATEIAPRSPGGPRLTAAIKAFRPARLPSGVQSIDQAPLDPGEREALERAGVAWLLPIDAEPVRALLLLGRRLAGTWLGRREILDLERFAEQLAVTLENADLRLEARSRGVLDRELKEAGAIQAHLLPRHAPVYPTLDCAAATLSCEAVGGDYYDFVQGQGHDRDLTLAVGDAAGKGVPAALLLAQVQARFRSQAQRGVTPGQILDALNQELVRLDQPEKFVGLLCARVEVRGAKVWVANGGITPPLIRRANGEFVEITSGGVLLGVSAGATYPDTLVELEAGDVVVVHTDGLTEARRGDEMFGTEGLRAILDETHGRRAGDILEALLAGVRSYTDGPLDDLTVVVLKQLTHPARNGDTRQAKFQVKKIPARTDAPR
jgi:serine phosphatase RsbU (regulator of sigma subunit)